jgi:1,4-dihydroxy-2-naphthoate octaprenyltransferase
VGILSRLEDNNAFWQGLWRLSDPKISLASIASMILGALAAAASGPLSLRWLVIVVVGILALEVAKNASGEIFDYRSGTDLAVGPEDRTPFSGGKRVLVDALLTPRQTALIAAVGYIAGISIGLGIVWFREPGVLWIGLVGVACAWFYHAPPVSLSYRGLGEVAVAICYGPLISAGTYLVLRNTVSTEFVLLSLPLGLLIGAFLWINEFPDYEADRASGKHTMVVKLGRERAAQVFLAVVIGAFLLLLFLPLLGLPRTVWLGGVSALPAFAAARRLLASPLETARIIPAQAWSLAAFVVYALGAGLGVFME